MEAVSLARMPILCSSLVTLTPGVPLSITNERIPERPAEGGRFFGLRWNPRGPFSLRGFYEHENNKATFSSPTPPTSDPSSYTANMIGMSVDWGRSLWQR